MNEGGSWKLRCRVYPARTPLHRLRKLRPCPCSLENGLQVSRQSFLHCPWCRSPGAGLLKPCNMGTCGHMSHAKSRPPTPATGDGARLGHARMERLVQGPGLEQRAAKEASEPGMEVAGREDSGQGSPLFVSGMCHIITGQCHMLSAWRCYHCGASPVSQHSLGDSQAPILHLKPLRRSLESSVFPLQHI